MGWRKPKANKVKFVRVGGAFRPDADVVRRSASSYQSLDISVERLANRGRQSRQPRIDIQV